MKLNDVFFVSFTLYDGSGAPKRHGSANVVFNDVPLSGKLSDDIDVIQRFIDAVVRKQLKEHETLKSTDSIIYNCIARYHLDDNYERANPHQGDRPASE